MPPEDLNESSDSEDFSWSEYLKETDAQAAPAAYFCQSLTPPVNEFEVDDKLETIDPRNTTSTCLGSVIETSGPRIRLRLDGTDDRNDFWLLVDSDLIHPYGHSKKYKRKIQPPLGFGNDLSKWPKFLEKIIQSADEKVFATEKCFKPTPLKPLKNEFKPGQKIEAVDPKNPHLICPGTIKEVRRDKLLVTFDGWSQSSQCWYSFTSRDIFPVGWCKSAGHILQYPGNLVDKKLTNSSVNQSKNNSDTPKVASKSLKAQAVKSNKKKVKPTKNSMKIVDTNNTSADSSGLNLTVNDTALHTSPSNKQQMPAKNQSTPNTQPPAKPVAHIDLSIVKQEALDSGNEDSNGHLKNVNLNSNGEINTNFTHNSCNNKKGPTNAFVHLIPNGDCGPLIKTDKFHLAHTKFGPGSAPSVYKSIIQSFVDCAVNRFEVFKLIPEGTSHDIVRLKNTTYNERKRLTLIENTNDMWSQLKSFCRLLDIDDEKLFSRQKSTPPIASENDKPQENHQESLKKPATDQDENHKMKSERNSNSPQKRRSSGPKLPVPPSNTPLPLTPQSSSMASSTTSDSSSGCQLPVYGHQSHEGVISDLNMKSISQKRSSTAASIGQINSIDGQFYEGQSVAKMSKIDESFTSLPTSEWNVDQVVNYICQLHDNYFQSYVETFKLQEIDGKALVLLTTDILMKYMGFKLGPALKLNNYIEKLRKNLIVNLNNAPNPNSVNVLKSECKDY